MNIFLAILNIAIWCLACFLWYRLGKSRVRLQVKKKLIGLIENDIQAIKELSFTTIEKDDKEMVKKMTDTLATMSELKGHVNVINEIYESLK